ncbi:BatA domain-containing protein [Candidatus Woesearchaeota archaeon]|nr:BatA domain-containing protein [Candidatus Woesearchaeota archaeon]
MAFNPLDLLQYADNKAGAWLFAGLIFFILMYLIKPKPSEKVVPSLMFLIRESHTQKSNSFLQKFLRDILVLIHLLILLLLSVAAMHPYYNTQAEVAAEHTVLVVDDSASMSTKDGLSTRLSEAVSKAKDHLEGKVSIILIQNSPFVVLRDGDKKDALDIVNYIPQTDATSSIGSSVLAADDLLQENKGKIVVISDFINTDPLDPYIAKQSLEAKGHTVYFVPIVNTASNVGIVDMQTVDNETTITVQNYNAETASVDVKINSKSYHLEIPANWQQKLTFAQQEGINTITLEQGDDFMKDNTILLSVPYKKETNVLVITNNQKSYIYPVMQAYAQIWNKDAVIEEGQPPVMPVIDHDVIILTEVDTANLPGSAVSKIKEAVNNGATLIVTGQDDIEDLGLDDVLPVAFADDPLVNNKVDVNMKNVLTAVTSGISISSVDKYMRAAAKENTLTLAATDDGVPLLAVGSYGQGTVVWYGLFDSNSTFKYDVTYPLFWQQLIDYVIGKDTIESLNYKIGEKVVFDNEIPVTTPSGKEENVDALEFAELGIYKYQNKQVAVNLLNSVESNVDYVNEEVEKALVGDESNKIISKQPITKALIAALLIILFLELLYVKTRGDF